MNVQLEIHPDTTIKHLLDRYPSCSQYFLKETLLCVGCAGEAHHTIAEVSQTYNLDLNKVILELNNYARRNS